MEHRGGKMAVLTLDDVVLSDQRVLIREDLNVPIRDGEVSSDARILASLPTIRQVLALRGRALILSHRGRPVEGERDPQFSLAPVARRLEQLLGVSVPLIDAWLDGVDIEPGCVALAENVRFEMGEGEDAPELARQMATLCDVFVMDAFGTAHRAQASTHGIAQFAPQACAGPLLVAELQALGQALNQPAQPLVAIVGGSKVSTKLDLLGSLSERVDQLIVGGGIANTFIAAAGYQVGKSLYEPDRVEFARQLGEKVAARGGTIPIPTDVVCAKAFAATAEATVKPVEAVAEDDLILDVGPQTAQHFAQMLKSARTIVWNGPVGVFEFGQFAGGTQVLAQAIAASSAFSIAGGGDTLAAIEAFGVSDEISYISPGGGAFLEFVEGKELPAVVALERRAAAARG